MVSDAKITVDGCVISCIIHTLPLNMEIIMSMWEPIETVPKWKTSQTIFLWDGKNDVEEGFWYYDGNGGGAFWLFTKMQFVDRSTFKYWMSQNNS